jgi:hypothetical protein
VTASRGERTAGSSASTSSSGTLLTEPPSPISSPAASARFAPPRCQTTNAASAGRIATESIWPW